MHAFQTQNICMRVIVETEKEKHEQGSVNCIDLLRAEVRLSAKWSY